MSAEIRRISAASAAALEANRQLKQTVEEALKQAEARFEGAAHVKPIAAEILKTTRESIAPHLKGILRNEDDISNLGIIAASGAKQLEKLEDIVSYTGSSGMGRTVPPQKNEAKPPLTDEELRVLIEGGADTKELAAKYGFDKRKAAAYKAVKTMREAGSKRVKIDKKAANFIRRSYTGDRTLADVQKLLRKEKGIKASISTISLYAKAKRR